MDAGADSSSCTGRRLRTLRVSVTARCGLDCSYCDASSFGGPAEAAGVAELSREEVALLAEAAALAGARTVRLTGGEPLLRDDLEDIVARVREVDGIEDVAITTNARWLGGRARALRDAGLDRLNIGLPSLRAETYAKMTGGELAPALAGLEAALDAGLSPVKVNVVVLREVNAGEVADFVELARTRPVEVRFIERMPFAGHDGLVPATAIRRAIAAALGSEGSQPRSLSPTAEVLRPHGFAGSVGLISPVTEPFCDRCDRLRVTSTGRLRSCLSEPHEVDLRPLLSGGAGPGEAGEAGKAVGGLAVAMREAFAAKPERHRASFAGPMRGIGG